MPGSRGISRKQDPTATEDGLMTDQAFRFKYALDAETLQHVRAIQKTLKTLDFEPITVNVSTAARLRQGIFTAREVKRFQIADLGAPHFAGEIEKSARVKLPDPAVSAGAQILAIHEGSKAAYTSRVSSGWSRSPRSDIPDDTVSNAWSPTKDINPELVDQSLEEILELEDEAAELLAISLGIRLDLMGRRAGVVLYIAIMAVLQVMKPELFDSLVNARENWSKVISEASRHWN